MEARVRAINEALSLIIQNFQRLGNLQLYKAVNYIQLFAEDGDISRDMLLNKILDLIQEA